MMIKLLLLFALVGLSLCQGPCTTNTTYCENRPSGTCFWSDPLAWKYCAGSFPNNISSDAAIQPGNYVLVSNVTFVVRSLTINPNLGVFFYAPFNVSSTFSALPDSIIQVDVPSNTTFYIGQSTDFRNATFTWNSGDLGRRPTDQELGLFGSTNFLIGVGLKTLYRSIQSSSQSQLVFQDGSMLAIDNAQVDVTNIDMGANVIINLKPNTTSKIFPSLITGDLHVYAPGGTVAIAVPFQANYVSVDSGSLFITEQFAITQINIAASGDLTIREPVGGANSSYNVLTNLGNVDLEFGCDPDQLSSVRNFPLGSILNYGDAIICAQFESGLITNNGTMKFLDQFILNASVITNSGNLTIEGMSYFIDTSFTNYGNVLGDGIVISEGGDSVFHWYSGAFSANMDVNSVTTYDYVLFDGAVFVIRTGGLINFLNMSDISTLTIDTNATVLLTGFINGGNTTRSVYNLGTLSGTGEIVGTLVNAGTLLDPDFDVSNLVCEESSFFIFNVESASNSTYVDLDGRSAYFNGFLIVNINVEVETANLQPFIYITNTTTVVGSLNTTYNVNFPVPDQTECSYQINNYKLDGGCYGSALSSSGSGPAAPPSRSNGGAIAAGILVPLIVIAAIVGGVYWYKKRGGAHAEYRQL